MQAAPLAAAFELLALGMGTVFLFLTLLVAAMTLMSRIVRRFEPPPVAPSPPASPPKVDAETRRAIEIAIRRYRSRR